MEKRELIDLLIDAEHKSDILDGRFKRVDISNGSEWVYHRPAIDCIEPTILIDDSRVFLTQKHIGGHEIITFSYDEFITKYNLK